MPHPAKGHLGSVAATRDRIRAAAQALAALGNARRSPEDTAAGAWLWLDLPGSVDLDVLAGNRQARDLGARFI